MAKTTPIRWWNIGRLKLEQESAPGPLRPNPDGITVTMKCCHTVDDVCRCGGRGWYESICPGTEDDYIPSTHEVYCPCARGQALQESEAK